MAGGNLYTPEEDALILRCYAENPQGYAVEASRQLGRSSVTIRQRAAVLRGRQQYSVTQLERSVRGDPGGAQVYAPLDTAQEPDEQFLERVFVKTDDVVARAKAMKYARVRIESDRPIGFCLASDMHLSTTTATNVRGIFALADVVAETPAMYIALVGDQTDNPIKHDPKSTKDVPDDLRLLDLLLKRFGTKLIGMTSGNHDDWTKTMVGLDNLQTVAERHALHYAPDELVWLVEIVKPGTDEITARWVVATRHQYRRQSNLNHTHACWRWMEEDMHNWPSDGKGASLLPDVVAIGHNHVAAVEMRTYQRGVVIACRMGSWQYTSPFTRAKGFTLMPATAPTVILPHIRDGVAQPVAYDQYEEAARVLSR